MNDELKRPADKEQLTQDIPTGPAKDEVKHKVERIEDVAKEMAPTTASQQCSRRILNIVKKAFADYYTQYPERALDDRSKDAEECSIHGIQDILRIINEYDIQYKPGSNLNPTKQEVK